MSAGIRRGFAVLVLLAAAAGGAAAQPDPGAGSADPGAGSAAPVDPGAGSAGAGSAGAGSAQILQLPTDIAAPQVSAAASPTVVTLGGKFTVFVTATYGDGVEVNLREPIDLGEVFEVTRKLSSNKRVADGRTVREWQLEVIAWELGDLKMPGIAVTYSAFGRAGQVQTNAVRLKIIGVLGDAVDDPKAVRDHAPPTELMRRDWFWLWLGVAIAAASGIAVGLLVWVTRRGRRAVRLVAGAVAAPRRMDAPSARALEQLLAIERSGVLDRDDDRKAGYTEMVEVVRDYVAARYRISVADLTTRELLQRLAPAAPPAECELVETWLERGDIVKYGGLRATSADAQRTLDDARALIVTTTEAVAPPGPAKEAA